MVMVRQVPLKRPLKNRAPRKLREERAKQEEGRARPLLAARARPTAKGTDPPGRGGEHATTRADCQAGVESEYPRRLHPCTGKA